MTEDTQTEERTKWSGIGWKRLSIVFGLTVLVATAGLALAGGTVIEDFEDSGTLSDWQNDSGSGIQRVSESWGGSWGGKVAGGDGAEVLTGTARPDNATLLLKIDGDGGNGKVVSLGEGDLSSSGATLRIHYNNQSGQERLYTDSDSSHTDYDITTNLSQNKWYEIYIQFNQSSYGYKNITVYDPSTGEIVNNTGWIYTTKNGNKDYDVFNGNPSDTGTDIYLDNIAYNRSAYSEDVGTDESSGGGSDTFDYTLGVCYSTDARFGYENGEVLATAHWNEGAQTGGGVLDYTLITMGDELTEFDNTGNTTNTVEDNDNLRYRTNISTLRAYFEISGLNPTPSDDYDQFVFTPPIDGDEEGKCDVKGEEPNSPPRVISVRSDPSPPNASEKATLTANVTDPDGTVENTTWAFPDGTTSLGKETSYTFEENGTQAVDILVTDDDGATTMTTVYFEVGANESNMPPTVWISYEPWLPHTNETVAFTAHGFDADGEVVEYDWTIAGEEGEGETVEGKFEKSGTYEVAVTATDDDGGKATTQTTIEVLSKNADNIKPHAYFTWDPILPGPGDTVTFTSSSFDLDGEIHALKWTFPDGTTKYGESVSKTFEEGDHDVTLTAIDDEGGEGSYTGTVTVSESGGIENFPPNVYFTWDPLAPSADEPVTLTADVSDTDGTVESRTWTLPNGSQYTGESLTVNFSEGSHEITLEAADDDGASAEYTSTITVMESEGIEGPTAVGICTVPGNGTSNDGVRIEYWDPSYSTVTLNYSVTHEGITVSGRKAFDDPKGYFYGCVGVGEWDLDPGDDPDWEINGTYENGTDWGYNGSTGIGGFWNFSSGGGGSGAFGAIPGTSGGLPTIPILAGLTAVGGAVYLRSRQTGQPASEVVGNAIRPVTRGASAIVNRVRP